MSQQGDTEIGTPDVFDSRDVIARIDYLADLIETGDERDYTEEDVEELRQLQEFAAESHDFEEDFKDGVTFIRDDYFKAYAMELAEEIGALPKEYSWPASCIDWDQAARELQMDYASIEFFGVTYWAR